jgi:hypothetical protein
VRPEDLQPVDAGTNGGGLRFDALVDTVESTGADLYAHARIDGELAGAERLDAVATEAAGAGGCMSRRFQSAARIERVSPWGGGRHARRPLTAEA